MKGRTNMPLEAVLALVHLVKARQQELRNHTKLDVVNGWTVRNQTWQEITTELNIRYGRDLTVDQCMKKLLNIKSMTRYKLEDQERKRQRPGMEHFVVKLTPAEREYISLFYHGVPPNPPVPGAASWEHIQMLLGGSDLRMPLFERSNSGERAENGSVKDEFLLGDTEVFEIDGDEAQDNLPDEQPSSNNGLTQRARKVQTLREPRQSRKGKCGKSMPNACNGRIWTDANDGTFLSMRTNHSCREGRGDIYEGLLEEEEEGNGTPKSHQSATATVKVEMGDSLTNAILGILPQHSSADDSVEASTSNVVIGRAHHSAPDEQHRPHSQQQMVDQQPQLISLAEGSTTAPLVAEEKASTAEVQRHSLLGPIPIRSHQQQHFVEGQQQSSTAASIGSSMLRNVPTATVRTANFAASRPQSSDKPRPVLSTNYHSDQHFSSRKRRSFHPHQSSSSLLMNGIDHNSADDVEAVELRLKRLKCELIEKQLMELGHQEEWRLKQEFLLGRQTAALENIVIQLRQIKDKVK